MVRINAELLTAATTTLAVELQECRAEAACAATDGLRSWFDGRAHGLERALELLDSAVEIDYQRRA